MSLRDILVTVIVFGLLPIILRRPHVGILVWSWLGYMNPHRLTWGFAYSFPFSQVVALVTLVSLLFSKEPKRIPMNGLTWLWLLFMLWVSITTIFALKDYAVIQYTKVMKIQLVTFLTVMLITTRPRIDALIWVIVGSIGFYGVKGGIFTIINLGQFRVWGPPGSFIADNNELALACLMTIPLIIYLIRQQNRQWARIALLGAAGLMAVTAFGSYSRGAMVASGVLALYLWWKTPQKLFSGIAMLVLGLTLINFMPDAWHERMDTIINYQEDGSAMGRLQAWDLAINVANHRPLGAGFSFWGPDVYRMFSPDPSTWNSSRAAHSIYFSVLGEHGWIGFLLFISVLIQTWRAAGKLRKECKERLELKWVHDLAVAIQVSFVVYMSGGSFYNLAYFDLPWHLVALVIILRDLVEKSIAENENLQAGTIRPREIPVGGADRSLI